MELVDAQRISNGNYVVTQGFEREPGSKVKVFSRFSMAPQIRAYHSEVAAKAWNPLIPERAIAPIAML